MHSRPSICFVALNAYGVLSGRSDVDHIGGGAEVQQVLIAEELVRREYQVSFVTLDHGQPDGEVCRGVRVYKAYANGKGLGGLRFFHPRWTGLRAAMARANADVYYQRTGGLETGQVAMWCCRRGRCFIFATASDMDCYSGISHLDDVRSRLLYRYGLRRADRVVTQTGFQRHLLRQQLGIDSTVIRSCTFDPGAATPHSPQHDGPPCLLWLGRFCEPKRLEWLLDLAEACPELIFDLVGDYDLNTDYARQSCDRASGLANVRLNGWIPHAQLDPLYRRSVAVLCTSSFEGFPNTFLEAWARGIPVISTLDPDGVINRNQLGFVAADVAALGDCCRELVRDAELRARLGANARRYYKEHHTVQATVDQYERLFASMTCAGSRTEVSPTGLVYAPGRENGDVAGT